MHRQAPALRRAAAAALLFHGLLLGGLHWAWPEADRAPDARIAVANAADSAVAAVGVAAVAAVELRAVVPAAEARPARAEAVEPATRSPAQPKAAARRPLDRPEPTATATRATHAPGPPPFMAAPSVAATRSIALAAARADLPASDVVRDDDAPPTYPTRVPPAATLRYRLVRGDLNGSGELVWQPDGGRYTLGFSGRLGAGEALVQRSEGGFDAAGIAPLRFVERRFRRTAMAANFRRDIARIGFSGKAADAPLHAGSQDRLSWMLQLAAIVAADPELRREGARVLIQVAGAAGDVAVWAFHCTAAAVTEPATGTEATVGFVREPRGPYDIRAEVWLDPGHAYLPARAVWKAGPADDGFDLQIEASPADAARP